MKRIALLAAALAVAAAGTAQADDDDHRHKHKHRHKHGKSETTVIYMAPQPAPPVVVVQPYAPPSPQMVVVQRGGPPPWAPAHGHRRKQGGQMLYAAPFGIDRGSCNRELVGSLLGAAAGGALGAQIGDGTGRLAATAAGTLAGFIAGGSIGRSMDSADLACVGQVLEYAPERRRVVWSVPGGGPHYTVIPTRTWRDGGAYCREYQTVVTIGGVPQQAWGRACRSPDGSWQTVG